MKSIEVTGKNIDDAIAKALQQLNVTKDEIELDQLCRKKERLKQLKLKKKLQERLSLLCQIMKILINLVKKRKIRKRKSRIYNLEVGE